MKKYVLIFILLLILFNIKFEESKSSNHLFISDILSISNSHLVKKDSCFQNVFGLISNIEINNPVSMFDKVFAYKIDKTDMQDFSYIQNIVVDNPKVYIYSTHPLEKYIDDFNVVDASYVLQEKLNSIGIETIVESRNVVSYMKENNISDSYSVSRIFLKEALKNNDFDLIIDLHRDQVPSSVSTKALINGKSYAKVMFVMNKYYEDNYAFANKFNNLIALKYPGLTRGIYNKYINNFNQDINSNVLLLELGSTLNNSEEVNNSIDVLVDIIKELLNEKQNN